MGHFRVTVCLGFEVNLDAPLLHYCKGNEFDLHNNMQLISIWMFVHQGFETEACSNSEMGY